MRRGAAVLAAILASDALAVGDGAEEIRVTLAAEP